MSFQNNKYTLRLADTADNEGIREIFESESFRGNLDVKFLRNPAPYESFSADGDAAKLLVAEEKESGKLIAVGGAVTRKEFVNGREENCAYLTGLKIHPDHRKKFFRLMEAYDLIHENIRDCAYVYTTVLDSNTAAIKMFEKKRKGMPEYKYLGHYTTYCFHGGRRKLSLEKNRMDGFEDLLRTYFAKQSLVPCNYDYKGFGEKDFYCVRKDGELIACCFVGNQQAGKQYKMCSYGGVFRFLSKLPTQWFGYPKFPKADRIINHGVVSYLYVKDNNEKLCGDFLRSVAAESGFDLLLWGAFENHPLCDALNNMKTVKYGSRLYSVTWNGDAGKEIAGIIGMEAALL